MRNMTRALSICCLLTAILLAVHSGFAQEPTRGSVSRERIQAAIKAGTANNDVKPMKVGLPGILRRSGMVTQIGTAYTPDLRIALAARAALATYKPFTEADVTPDLAADYVLLVLPPINGPRGSGPLGTKALVELETVLLLPRKSKDASLTVRPLWTTTKVETVKNFGLDYETLSVLAAFSDVVLDPEMDIVAVYKSQVDYGGGPQKREIRATLFDRPRW